MASPRAMIRSMSPHSDNPANTTAASDFQLLRSKYRFGRTLGAGTYGIVREADSPIGKVAVKIILKKNVKGNERMVYDELDMLQRLKHPHIVRFVDWFESRVRRLVVTLRERLGHWANTDRTNTTSSRSWLKAASYLIESASRESSPRRMPHKQSSRSSAPSTIFTRIMLFIEVSPLLSRYHLAEAYGLLQI